MRTSPPVPAFSRVLCVAAHPDDLEFGAAGTVASLGDAGADVTYLIATRGQSGSSDPKWTPESLASVREDEQRRAAAVLGVSRVVFLDFYDAYVHDTIDLRRAISREIRRYRPQLLIGMRPGILLGTFVNHPDHRNVATALLDSVVTGATTRMIFPELLDEGLEPWKGIEEVWLMGPGPVDGDVVLVDVTHTIDRKLEALRCHASQLTEWDPTGFIRERTAELGRAAAFDHAEAFLRVMRRVPTPPREGS